MKKIILAILLLAFILTSYGHSETLNNENWPLLEKAMGLLTRDRDGDLSVATYLKEEKTLIILLGPDETDLWTLRVIEFEKRADSLVGKETHFYHRRLWGYLQGLVVVWDFVWNEQRSEFRYSFLKLGMIGVTKEKMTEIAEPYLKSLIARPIDYFAAHREAAEDLGLIDKGLAI